MASCQNFSLEIVAKCFQSGLTDDEDVLIEHFIAGYNELNKLICSLGKLFYFVSKDIVDKIRILSKYLKNEEISCHYTSVRRMLDFEKSNKILKKSSNGSRNLLRLHRALLLILYMMEKLSSEMNMTLTEIVKVSYQDSLAEHHIWAVQKAVGLAAYTLPTKEIFVQNLADSQPEGALSLDECKTILVEKVVPSLRDSYDRVQKLYAERDMLNLP